MIKVTDVAYARFRAPDLEKMEDFLIDFGLERSARTDDTLYMRACGTSHHVHVTELGDPAFIGMAFHAANADDLNSLSEFSGVSKPQSAALRGWQRASASSGSRSSAHSGCSDGPQRR